MDRLSSLTNSLCVISVVSALLSCILPDNSQKSIFKIISGLVVASIIINCLFAVINIDYDNALADDTIQFTEDIENYIVEKNTKAYLKDIDTKTQSIFSKYDVSCNSIVLDSDNSTLVFYVDKDNSLIESELERLIEYECLVIVGDFVE